ISGAGIAGSYDVPVIGHFDSITQEIPFRTLYINLGTILNPMKVQTLNIRGAIQVTDSSTGLTDFAQIRYMIKGRTKSLSPGNLKPGDVMGSKIAIEASSLLIEIGGSIVLEIDKLNNIFRVDGVDLLEKVRKMC
ncbi:MAG: phage major tail tube protein, partial [Hungatella sp.]